MINIHMDTQNQDLLSIQEARELIQTAHGAEEVLAEFDQAKIDRIIDAMAKAGYENSRRLAKMAVDETQIGVVEDKVLKNQFASKNVYEYIRDLKQLGLFMKTLLAR